MNKVRTVNPYTCAFYFVVFMWLTFTATGDTLVQYKFVSIFWENPSLRPWESVGSVNSQFAGNGGFPYPPVMFGIFAILRYPTYALGLTSDLYSPLGALFMNLGILGFLILTIETQLHLIKKFIADVSKDASLYIRVLHLVVPGMSLSVIYLRQNDIYAIGFLSLSLLFLLNHRYGMGLIFLVSAIALKTFAVFLIPIFAVIAFKQKKIITFLQVIFIYGLIVLLVTELVSGPFYDINMGKNNQLARLFSMTLTLGDSWSKVLVLPSIYMAVYVFFAIRKQNPLELILVFALTLNIPMLFSPGNYNWWAWSGPFYLTLGIIFFFMKEKLIFSLVLFTQVAQFLYATYFEWSWTWQIFSWQRFGLPLPKSPYAFVASSLGENYAILITNTLFTIAWVGNLILLGLLARFITGARLNVYMGGQK
jgi:hypothetical protein